MALETDLPSTSDNSLKQIFSRSKALSTSVGNILQLAVTKTHEAQKRSAMMGLQSELLGELDGLFDRVEELWHAAAIQVARLRAQEQVLRICRILNGCRCPYCRCYSSPFSDGQGNSPLADQSNEALTIVQAHCAIKKATRSVCATTTWEEETCLVTSVQPDILEEVGLISDQIQDMLNKCASLA
jgi:hypothetical protein